MGIGGFYRSTAIVHIQHLPVTDILLLSKDKFQLLDFLVVPIIPDRFKCVITNGSQKKKANGTVLDTNKDNVIKLGYYRWILFL